VSYSSLFSFLFLLCVSHLHATKVVAEWLTLLLRVQEVPGSNFDPGTGYPEGFRGFPQSLQANARIVAYLKIRSRPLPSKSFPINHLLITLSFDAI
jgi:hypothetical protein